MQNIKLKKETLKNKSNSSQKTASPEQIYFVGINGIKVYPVSQLGSWFIEVNNNGLTQRFEKKVPQNELNSAIAKTIIWYYNKLKEK
jgi:hypothetical protein